MPLLDLLPEGCEIVTRLDGIKGGKLAAVVRLAGKQVSAIGADEADLAKRILARLDRSLTCV